ncbi:hypothetical protein BD626DRAFT_542080 [Schizophyllum amplum]|uniref:Uncharacterized protein n=1 Tax=Schizophyllum amplum TaxID=97359 RepID=A0A550BST4_9AGAR|nr:hypothetical protein BD626DRAFT_542080 [Auriculariopsis ampla]
MSSSPTSSPASSSRTLMIPHAVSAVIRATKESNITSFVICVCFVQLADLICAHLAYNSSRPGSRVQSWFSVAQAAFLSFCFRGRDVLKNEELILDELGSRKEKFALDMLHGVRNAPLNPLHNLHPRVVDDATRASLPVPFAFWGREPAERERRREGREREWERELVNELAVRHCLAT